MKLTKKDKFNYVLFAIICISTCSFLLYDYSKLTSLKSNLEYAKAIITDISKGTKGRRYIDYIFFVNKKQYKGYGKHYLKSDTFLIGDTILIVYDKTNPGNNRTYRDIYK